MVFVYCIISQVKILSREVMYVHRFLVKTSFVGGIVYYTVQQGLWSNSEDCAQLYGKIYNNVTPYVKDNIPKEMMKEVSFTPRNEIMSF